MKEGLRGEDSCCCRPQTSSLSPLPIPSADLPPYVGDQLGDLWTEVVQPHAALRSKMLSALTRPFDEATNNAGPGACEGKQPMSIEFGFRL